MLWVKAFHIIAMVAWFSGLFYVPRLFVYHAIATDQISLERFKIMERKLFYGITTPAAILTLFFGIWLLSFNWQGYIQMRWLHWKLTCVLLLVCYHIYLGYLLHRFRSGKATHSPLFYRILNEVPAVFLTAIVILVVVKPFGMIAVQY